MPLVAGETYTVDVNGTIVEFIAQYYADRPGIPPQISVQGEIDEDVYRLILVLQEGRNREVRRLLETVGHPVKRLFRRSFGPIEIGARSRIGANVLLLHSVPEDSVVVAPQGTVIAPRSAPDLYRMVEGLAANAGLRAPTPQRQVHVFHHGKPQDDNDPLALVPGDSDP